MYTTFRSKDILSLSVLSHVFGAVDKTSSSFSAHGKIGNFIIIRPLKLQLSCGILEKNLFWGFLICRGGDTPDFGHEFSNCIYFRPCGRFSFSSVQRAWRLEREKRQRKERKKNLVKY